MGPREEEVPLHGDRGRAESFGAIAERYDRFRPAIPALLVDRFVSRAPRAVLDIACGTGKVGVTLKSRGLDVLGMELDERMADVARAHGLPVEVSPFESWPDAGRQFDLLTCGNAWHWLEPQRATDKAAQLLRSGGLLARFWSYYVLEQDVLADLKPVYDALAPSAHLHGSRSDRHDELLDGDPVKNHPAFETTEIFVPSAPRDLTTDEWIGLLGTYSDHQRLTADLPALERAVRDVLSRQGNLLHAKAETFAQLTQRR